jgi:hypothetical protein
MTARLPRKGAGEKKARFTLTDPGVGGYQSLHLLAQGAAAGLRVRFRIIQGRGSEAISLDFARFYGFKKC